MKAKNPLDDPYSPESYYMRVNCGVETTLPPVPLTDETKKALRTAGRKAQEWVEERDRLIKQARAEGASLREIAEHAGISHTAVGFIAHGRPK